MARKPANTKTHRYKVTDRGSIVVQSLEAAWELLIEIEPTIPPAVLTLVDVKSRDRLRGYAARSRWKKRHGRAIEIGINPELIGHPKDLLVVILHEAAHAVLYRANGNGGIGSGGDYHLKSFREQCEKFGLRCEFLNTRHGFVLTSWPNGKVPIRFQPIVQVLRDTLPAGTGAPPMPKFKGNDLPKSGHSILFCGCKEANRSVYVNKGVLEVGGILCAICKQEFRKAK